MSVEGTIVNQEGMELSTGKESLMLHVHELIGGCTSVIPEAAE